MTDSSKKKNKITIRSYLKYFFKNYVPEILQPIIYKLYNEYQDLRLIFLYRGVLDKFINEASLVTLREVKTVQIIQPTFYDLDGIHYFTGGAERYLNDLSQIIRKMGYKPFIVQLGSKFWHKNHNGIDVFGVPSDYNYGLLNEFAHNRVFGDPALRIYSPFTLASHKVDKNAIGISHGIFWDHPHAAGFFNSIFKAFNNLNTIISVDTSTISWFRGTIPHKLYGTSLHYIPNYVDLDSFYPVKKTHSDRIKIIYPRRLYAQRGYFLVEAIVEKLLKKYAEIEFHFVGTIDDSAIDSIRNLVKKFENRVFSYQKLDTEMHEVYKEADIVLIPTVASEGTSLSCLEAMATGNAIIATNVGGLTDLIIDGYNGLLIDPNSQTLQDAIELLVTNLDLRKRLGVKALEVAQVFSKTSWAKRWEKILEPYLNKSIR